MRPSYNRKDWVGTSQTSPLVMKFKVQTIRGATKSGVSLEGGLLLTLLQGKPVSNMAFPWGAGTGPRENKGARLSPQPTPLPGPARRGKLLHPVTRPTPAPQLRFPRLH